MKDMKIMKDTKRDEVCNPVTRVLYADVFKRFRRGCKPRPAWMTRVDTRPIYARR